MSDLLPLLQKIVHRGNFTLRAGDTTDVYIDVKMLFGDPEILKQIATALRKKIPADVTCLAASGYGGIPLGVVLSSETGIPLALVRDKKKDHGIEAQVLGYMPSINDAVLIIDDVFTTGNSIETTYKALESSGAKIVGALVVIKRGPELKKIPLDYLYSIEELLKQ